jgi:hypothetical protein
MKRSKKVHTRKKKEKKGQIKGIKYNSGIFMYIYFNLFFVAFLDIKKYVKRLAPKAMERKAQVN